MSAGGGIKKNSRRVAPGARQAETRVPQPAVWRCLVSKNSLTAAKGLVASLQSGKLGAGGGFKALPYVVRLLVPHCFRGATVYTTISPTGLKLFSTRLCAACCGI